MVCIVITRNGTGDAYKFRDKRAARLSPITQLYDVVAADSKELAEQYGRDEADSLLRFAEGRDRARLVDAFETWRSEPRNRLLSFEARDLAWRLVLSAAKEPPLESSELVSIISEDRLAVESGIRSRPESATQGEYSPHLRKEREMSEAEKKSRKPRMSDEAVIKILVDKNPKRANTKAAERFGYYKDGQTVKAAKDAGVTAADLAYDVAHNYISVTEPASA